MKKYDVFASGWAPRENLRARPRFQKSRTVAEGQGQGAICPNALNGISVAVLRPLFQNKKCFSKWPVGV